MKILKYFFNAHLSNLGFKILLVYIFIAIFADFLAYSKPFIAFYNNEIYFPWFKDWAVYFGLGYWDKDLIFAEWSKLKLDFSIWPIIPYNSTEQDLLNISLSPFDNQQVTIYFRHWLGTDPLGRDVLSGLIHGARISILVGFISSFLAAIFGTFLGIIAAYFGDNYFKISRIAFIFNPILIVIAWFYGFYIFNSSLIDSFSYGIIFFFFNFLMCSSIFTFIIFLGNLILNYFAKILNWKMINFPMDILISRLIEFKMTIPSLMLVITISTLTKPSVLLVIFIIAFVQWTHFARIVRGEVIKLTNQEFILASQTLGINHFRIIYMHILPNIIQILLTSFILTIASSILAESTLSFLNLGVPVSNVTWGTLLQIARHNPLDWWLSVFPGLAIFGIIYSLLSFQENYLNKLSYCSKFSDFNFMKQILFCSNFHFFDLYL